MMSRQEEIHFYINMIKYPIPLPNKKIIKHWHAYLYNDQVRISSRSLFLVALLIQNLCLQTPTIAWVSIITWGSSMGSFIVYTYSTVRGLKREYRIDGDQGNQWNNLELDLKLDNSTWVRVTRTLFAKLYLCVY